jgi:hypothetical protein
MGYYVDQIKSLFLQFLPTGRAFKSPKNGWTQSLSNALALSENKAYNDAMSILNSILPDNANFTTKDATDWEKRLGLIVYSPDPPLGYIPSLADRMLAIKAQMNHPGDIKPRQNYLYVQGQLRLAGFNVSVFENRFDDGMGGYETKTPIELAGMGGVDQNQHGDHQHGDAQHGGTWGDLVANSVDWQQDLLFDVGANLRSTFFIGGDPVGSPAYVPADRRVEFRQLILKLKPTQTVAYLFIVYT